MWVVVSVLGASVKSGKGPVGISKAIRAAILREPELMSLLHYSVPPPTDTDTALHTLEQLAGDTTASMEIPKMPPENCRAQAKEYPRSLMLDSYRPSLNSHFRFMRDLISRGEDGQG